MKYEQLFKVGVREVATENKITNFGILAFLQDVATNHSDISGYGIKDTLPKHMGWVILDWYIEVKKRVPFGTDVYAKTWAIPIDKPTFHVYRNFELRDSSNDIIATATSKWVLFDTLKNKIIRLNKEDIELYKPEGNSDYALLKISKLKEPSFYYGEYEYCVKRSDIDVNNHMNNIKYLSLANEALPEDIYFNNEFNNIRITYKHQIKLGCNVRCYYAKEDEKHYVVIKSEDENVLHAIVELY